MPRPTKMAPLKVLQEASDDSSFLVGSPFRVIYRGKVNGKNEAKNKPAEISTGMDKENVRQTRSTRSKSTVPTQPREANTRSQSNLKVEKVLPSKKIKTTKSSSKVKDSIVPYLLTTPEDKTTINDVKENKDVVDPKTKMMNTTFLSDSNNESTIRESPVEVAHRKQRKAYQLMVDKHIPENYWKDLAHQRELALEEVLKENAMLQDNIQVLEAENAQLARTVREAEILAQCVKEIMSS